MNRPFATSLIEGQLPKHLQTVHRSRPRLWTSFAVLFFLMLGIGWIPEELLKLPALHSVSVGELLLMAAVSLNWRAVFGRLASPQSRTFVDTIMVVLLIFVTLNIVRNISAGYPLEEVLRNSRRMFYYTFYFLLVASIRDRELLVKAVKILTVLFMVGALSYFITLLFDVPLASRIVYSYGAEAESFPRVYHVIFPMAVVVGFIHFSMLLTGVRQVYGVSSRAAFMTATLLVYLSYYRNYYVTYLVGLLVIAMAEGCLRPRALVRAGATLVFVATVVLGGLSLVGVLGPTIERMGTLGIEASDLSGTVASRIVIWGIRYDTISSINPLLGAGFIWEQDPDRTTEDVILDPLVPDNDNGYAAALVLLGFVGIALFVLLYLAVLRLAAGLLRSQPRDIERVLSISSVGLAVYVLMNNIGLDNFYWPYAVLPNLVLLGALNAGVLLERKRTKCGEGWGPELARSGS